MGEAKAAVMAAPAALVHKVGCGAQGGWGLSRIAVEGLVPWQHTFPHQLPACSFAHRSCLLTLLTLLFTLLPAGAAGGGPAAGLRPRQLRGGGRQAVPGHGE